MNFKSYQAFFMLLLLFMASCDSNRWEVEVEQVDIKQPFNRFELELLKAAENGITSAELQSIQIQFPAFYSLYVQGVMNLGAADSPQTLVVLNEFMANKDVRELFKRVAEKFPENELNTEKEELLKAFKRFHYYFPKRVVPSIHTMVATFNYAAVTDDSLLGIGLDTYMGADFEIYNQVGIPKYKSKNFNREYLVSDAVKAWLITDFESDGGKDLLEQMVFQGKIIYLLSALLPNEEEFVYFNYNREDLAWCQDNESPIWFHFVDMELLFAKESHQIRKYMGDAPFIAGFPEGSPGRVGHWVGYQIVSAYMQNNKEVSLQQLMQTDDANKILRESNYKPKR